MQESQTAILGEHCSYRFLDNRIHEFVMKESSRAAVDDFIKALDYITLNTTQREIPIPSLMDSSVGVQPIRYIFGRLKDYMSKNSNTTRQSTKFALILPESVLTRSVGGMMSMFPSLKTRLFTPEERDKAVEWLLE